MPRLAWFGQLLGMVDQGVITKFPIARHVIFHVIKLFLPSQGLETITDAIKEVSRRESGDIKLAIV